MSADPHSRHHEQAGHQSCCNCLCCKDLRNFCVNAPHIDDRSADWVDDGRSRYRFRNLCQVKGLRRNYFYYACMVWIMLYTRVCFPAGAIGFLFPWLCGGDRARWRWVTSCAVFRRKGFDCRCGTDIQLDGCFDRLHTAGESGRFWRAHNRIASTRCGTL